YLVSPQCGVVAEDVFARLTSSPTKAVSCRQLLRGREQKVLSQSGARYSPHAVRIRVNLRGFECTFEYIGAPAANTHRHPGRHLAGVQKTLKTLDSGQKHAGMTFGRLPGFVTSWYHTEYP
ncbi:MAG TPA: hypothetical protein PKV86_04835, partial [Syntrophobacteraceae bacterium]|nr:hypothetical protein [Syntrophobacteraceae bacterium]